jgi:hypothetical protein
MKCLFSLIAVCGLFVHGGAFALPEQSELKEHTETITDGDHSFVIEVGATLDPENVEITIENSGPMPVVNPRITVNGKYNWYTLHDLAAEITTGGCTDEEKVWAIFQFVQRESYWWGFPKDRSAYNPVRHFNIYGYHICARAAAEFVALCRAVGIDARVYELGHHTVAEAWWEGAWHGMDPDLGMWYLAKDNRTIASIAELETHPEWVARTYKPYRWYLTPDRDRRVIYKPDSDPAGDPMATIYATKEDNHVETDYDEWLFTEQDMNVTLCPGETLVRWWKPVLRKYYDQKTTMEPPRYANGQLVFEPDFSRFTYDGLIEASNVAFVAQDGIRPAVHVRKPQDPRYDQPSRLAIPIKSPYVMVGGYIDTRYYKGGTSDLDIVSLSADLDPVFHQRTHLWTYYSWAYGSGRCRAVLDEKMRKDGPQGTYAIKAIYSLSADRVHANDKASFPLVYGGQSGIEGVKIVVDLQVNPGSLPALALGKNVIRYTDESAQGRKVNVTYKWRERSGNHRPEAPAAAIAPADAATVGSLAPTFRWMPATDQDGDKIACYRFQLSSRPDAAWPLSPNFDRDIRTGSSFHAPAGWLNPKTTYYWRVQAEDAHGNAGPWSKVFSFRTK